eukprot:2143216-Pleurochrysis_carterae.AAC.1
MQRTDNGCTERGDDFVKSAPRVSSQKRIESALDERTRAWRARTRSFAGPAGEASMLVLRLRRSKVRPHPVARKRACVLFAV